MILSKIHVVRLIQLATWNMGLEISRVVRSGERDLGVIQTKVIESLRHGVNGLWKEKYSKQQAEKPRDRTLSCIHIFAWEEKRKSVMEIEKVWLRERKKEEYITWHTKPSFKKDGLVGQYSTVQRDRVR